MKALLPATVISMCEKYDGCGLQFMHAAQLRKVNLKRRKAELGG